MHRNWTTVYSYGKKKKGRKRKDCIEWKENLRAGWWYSQPKGSERKEGGGGPPHLFKVLTLWEGLVVRSDSRGSAGRCGQPSASVGPPLGRESHKGPVYIRVRSFMTPFFVSFLRYDYRGGGGDPARFVPPPLSFRPQGGETGTETLCPEKSPPLTLDTWDRETRVPVERDVRCVTGLRIRHCDVAARDPVIS